MKESVTLLAGKSGTSIVFPNGTKLPISADPAKPTVVDWPESVHAARAARYCHGVSVVKPKPTVVQATKPAPSAQKEA